jgi:sugar lactone lactonase YvrE
VADLENHCIRKIDTSGTVTTFAGDGTAGFFDAQGTFASFNNPSDIAIDNVGNIYVVDTENHCIRKIDTLGNVTTIAGDGTAGFLDAQGTSARFYNPTGITIDNAGNIYVADFINHRIRKLTRQ